MMSATGKAFFQSIDSIVFKQHLPELDDEHRVITGHDLMPDHQLYHDSIFCFVESMPILIASGLTSESSASSCFVSSAEELVPRQRHRGCSGP